MEIWIGRTMDNEGWTVNGGRARLHTSLPLEEITLRKSEELDKVKELGGEEGSRKSMEAEAEAEEEVGVRWIDPSAETDWREKCESESESESEKITPSYLEVSQRVSLMIGSPLPPPTQMISFPPDPKKKIHTALSSFRRSCSSPVV